jgi:hypothetical protein
MSVVLQNDGTLRQYSDLRIDSFAGRVTSVENGQSMQFGKCSTRYASLIKLHRFVLMIVGNGNLPMKFEN